MPRRRTVLGLLAALPTGITCPRLLAAADPALTRDGQQLDLRISDQFSPAARSAVIQWLEFIATLRIRHQANQIKKGLPPDNYVPPDNLSELEREHLKHAFKVIQTMQESMIKRFGADKLG